MRAIAENCIVTAGLDKHVKVWYLPEGPNAADKINLVAQFKTPNELISLKYNQETRNIAFMDSECNLGSIHLSEALISGRATTSSAELDEDIDMAEIDAMMNDEEGDAEIEFAAAAIAAKPSADSNADPIDLDEMKDAMSDAAAVEGTNDKKVNGADVPVEVKLDAETETKAVEEEKTSTRVKVSSQESAMGGDPEVASV